MVEFGTPVTQPDGSITVTGKVPEGTDSTVTVTVPEGSYDDTTGNPGQPGTGTGTVDTDRPQVEVTVTPNGDIVLTYPDDTDPSTITTDKITVKDPNGNDIVVDFGTPVTQPDGSITVTGKVPVGVDGTITVTVPESSYEDTTGNPGLPGQANGGEGTPVDTRAPDVTVDIVPNAANSSTATAVFKFSEAIDPTSFNATDLVVTGAKLIGQPVYDQATDSWSVELKVEPGQTVSVEVKPGSYTDLIGNAGTAGDDQLITVKITGVTPDVDENGSHITVITGKTEPGKDVVVQLPDGTTLPPTKAGVDGTWTITTTTPLQDGDFVTATTTDQDQQPIQDKVSLPLIYINVVAGDDVINEDELAGLTDPDGLFLITGTISNPDAEITVTVNGKPYTVDPANITPQGQWSLKVPATELGPDNSITAIAKTPTVTSEPAIRNPGLDNEAPTVDVQITEQGKITVQFVPDVNVASIDPKDFVVKDGNGDDITISFTPSADGLTYTAQLPDGFDSTVTVTVPEGSYEDVSGNPGQQGTGTGTVDTDRPQVEVTVTPNGDIVLTYPDDTDPSSITTDKIIVKDPNGKDIVVDFGTPVTQPDGSITVTGKVPEGTDSTITVTVPEGSYEDTTGNPGQPGTGTGTVDTDRPQVEVSVTPNGDIVLTYPDDTDPSTITTDKITVKDPTGKDIVVDFDTPETQPDGSITVTGKVPAGVDGTITVTVPEGSYEDTTGNPGQPGTGTGTVDTDRPQVEVTVTPNGDIVLTYPDDTDPSSITTDKITVKDPTGKDIVVDFGTPVTQPDGSITVTGKVPAGVDGTITVTVPEGSYEDVTGNPGVEGQDTTTVDTIAPEVAVTVTSSSADHTSATATFTFTEKIDPATFSTNDLIVTGGKVVGAITQVDEFTWTVELKTEPGVTVSVEVKDDSYSDVAGNTGKGDQDQLITLKITGVTPNTDANGDDITVITGKTEPNSEVSVLVPGQDTPLTVQSGPDGLWELTVPGILKDGNEVTATTTYEDKNGDVVSTGDEVELPFVYIDVVAGDDVINETELADLTETVDGQNFITVTGTISNPAADLVVNFNGTPYSGSQVTVTPQGQWSIRVPVADVKESNTVTAQATTDTATSNTAERQPGLDNQAPTVTVEITEQGLISIKYESDVNPSTVDVADYTVVDQFGKKVTVEYTVSEDGLTVTGKITSPVDGKVTVLVPKDSYQDFSGNNGTKGSASESVDTTSPTVNVTITPQGEIVVTYEDDVDPKSIDPKDIVVKDPSGNVITVELTPSADGLTYTGQVPDGIDGKVTVSVPTNSYEDLTGNPGKAGTGEGDVDTDRPQVEVTVTPEGQIIVTYPEDTDPTTIDPQDIIVKDPSGNDITVTLTPSDNGLTYTGKVPEGIDGKVTVDVPEGSYEDLTGNPGKVGGGEGSVDTDRPQVDVTVTPEGQIIVTYPEDTDPATIDPEDIVVKDPSGNVITVELTPSEGGLTYTGQVPEGIDGTVTVEVPEGSYEDLTGNPGKLGEGEGSVDTDRPQVEVTVTPEGQIIVEYPTDTDPTSITTDKIVVKDPEGNEITVTLTPSEGGLTYTGQVPDGVDGTVTVEVPENSYEDLTGNPGKAGEGKGDVDTDRPQVEVTVTPEGQIVVTYPEDTDPTSITTDKIVVKDPEGNEITVTLTPSEGGLTYTGQVPEGIDGTVTVEVPENSYEDLTGNPGKAGEGKGDVDTDRPQVEVTVTPEGQIVVTYPEDTDPTSITTDKIVVKDPEGNEITVTLTPSEDGLTYTGQVPDGIDGTVTVDVPENSYEDLTGNPGKAGEGKGSVDTDRPQVGVEITPNGDIILTYPEDTDPTTIGTSTITVEGPKGPITVEFGTPEVQTDGTVVVTAKVPEGVDGQVTVTVPEGSYEDLTGNPGKVGETQGNVDTDRPSVEITLTPQGSIVIQYEDDVDPTTIDPKDIVITDENGNPIKVELTVSPDGLTLTGQIPPNVDSKVTVIVPEGSYQDKTGNEGQYDIDSKLVDTDVPEVTVTVDPQGNITVTYPEDTDPKTIKPDAIVVKDPTGKEITVELTPSPDGLTYTAKVPEGIDGKVTVDVPAGSYEDLTGNPGTPSTGKYPVDTIAPTVEITLTPTGDIVVKFEDDVDPKSIDPETIIITDKDGKPVEVTLTPSEDGLTYTGKIPSGVDEQITVEVPTGSYTDLVGNPGVTDKETVDVDTIAPTVIVDIIAQATDSKATATFEFSEKIDPASFSSADLKVTGGQIVGQPTYNETTGLWSVELKVEPGQTVTVEVLPESYTDEAGNKGSGESDRLITVNITAVTPNTTEDGTHVTVITGKTEPGHDVVVTLPDGTELPPVKAGPDGTWTTTTELPLKDGDDLSASTTDQDGNPTKDTVSLPLISINVIAGDDVINEEEMAELTDEDGNFIITGTISNPNAAITVDVNGTEYTVDPADITPTGQWTLKVPATEIKPENSITATAKTDTVTSEPAIRNPGLDNDAPTVQIDITPQGEIKVTFAPDVDPATIDPKDFVITSLDGKPVVIDFTPSEDRLTYTGQVPTGVDTSITVKVPEASYSDKAGNPGEEGSETVTVDTAPPVAEVTVTPDGKITITYPDDTKPDTIDTTGIIVEGPDGEVIPGVTFEEQPDGTYTAKVPEGIDGDIVVKVPAGSYEDTTGNSGEPVKQPATVDTESPVVDVQIDENGKITLTYPEDTDPDTIDTTGIVVEGPNGPISDVTFEKQPDGTYTAKVPEGVDGEIVVKVPAGSYEDTTGNSGEPVEQPGTVDTDTPTATVTITPDGKITVTYPDDVDPSTITEELIVVEGPKGPIEVPFTPPVKQPDGSYVVTGEVPEGTDGEIVVKVPAGSYEDTTGNSGEPVAQPGTVDTDTPTAEVTITPDGKITVTYPDDVDPSTITEDKIVVEGPNGPIEVPFTPAVKQPDGSYVVTGEVPEGTDGDIVVKVPAGSYEDTTGNSGEPVEKQGTIDTESPAAEVTIEPNGEIIVTYSPDADKTTIDPADIVVKDSKGNTIVVDFVPSNDGLTYTGKVPTAIDENITVTVPENSFKDTTGNDNTTSVKTDPVDTIAPKVEVVITPEGQITLKYEDDVVPSTIDTSKIVIVDGNGKSVPVTFTPSENGLTLVGQVPDGIDSQITVTVPSGSYQDEVGNKGGKGSTSKPVDTQSPEVEISITPDGKITITYPDDVNPDSIEEGKIVVEGPNGPIEVPFTPPVKQPDGSYVVTGEVPEGTDGNVTVTVPTESYEDTLGNPGEEVDTTVPVDTIPPKAEVTVTPDGKITVTYPDDVDPNTIVEESITVTIPDPTDPNETIDIPVTFNPPVKQPDGSYVVTGEVPPGVDGTVTVTVPGTSYEDESGNPGEPNSGNGKVDTDVPTAIVTIQPNGDIVIKYPEDTNPDSIDTSTITFTDKDGDPVVVELTPSTDGKTFTGKVPNGNDTDITVSIPTGSYTDETGNPGAQVDVTEPVDTIAPNVNIDITPNGQITLTFDDDTVPSTIQTGKITVTDKSGNPIVVEFVPSQDDPLVLVGRVPEGTETGIVVTVPAGSYQDDVGNKGTLDQDSADVDAVPPVAVVTITPDGKITVTYPDDVDPSTITEEKIIVEGPNGPIEVPFNPPVEQPDGSYIVTGEVPPGVDGDITVTVPTDSYEDKSGNPGEDVTTTETPVDTVPPKAEVTITPDGKITVTYPDDVDPSTITEDKIIVEGPNGPIEVPFNPPVEQPDGSYIVTGEVPPGVDGKVTVTVPTDSYEDKSGNPGEEVDKTVPVDNIAPEVETTQVVTKEDQSVTLTWAHFGISDANTANDQLVITVTNLPKDGVLTIVDAAGNKTPIIAGQTLSYADINAGKVVFAPDANEASATDGGVYAGLEFNVSDGKHVTSGELEIVVDAVADKPSLTLDLLDWNPTVINLNKTTWSNLGTVNGNNLTANGGSGASKDALKKAFEYLLSDAGQTAYKNQIVSTGNTNSLVSEGNITAKTGVAITGYVFLEAGTVYKYTGKADDSGMLIIGNEDPKHVSWKGITSVDSTFTVAETGFYTFDFYMHNAEGDGNYNFKVVEESGKELAYYPDLKSAIAGLNDFYSATQPSVEWTVSDLLQKDATDKDQYGFHRPYFNLSGEVGEDISLGLLNTKLNDQDGSENLTLNFSGLVEGMQIYAVTVDGARVLLGTADTNGNLSFVADGMSIEGSSLVAIAPPSLVVTGNSLQLNVKLESVATEKSNGSTASSELEFGVILYPASVTNVAPEIEIEPEVVTVGSAVSGQKIATYAASDADNDSLTVTFANGSTVSADGFYQLSVVDQSVTLTQKGADQLNSGAALPSISLQVTDGKVTTPVTGNAELIELKATLTSEISVSTSTSGGTGGGSTSSVINVPNLGTIYKDAQGNYVSNDLVAGAKIVDIAAEMQAIINDPQYGNDFNNITNALRVFNNLKGDNSISEIIIINWENINKVLTQNELGFNFSNSFPQGFSSQKGTPSDWIVFDEAYSGAKYPVNSMVLNNSDTTNYIDGFNLSITGVQNVNGFQINMLEGVLFADGTQIAKTGEKNQNGQDQLGVVAPEAGTPEKVLQFTLHAEVLNDAEANVNVNGVKFKSAALDALVDAKVSVNGISVSKDSDGYYTYQGTSSSQVEDFVVKVTVPETSIQDVNVLTTQLETELGNSNNVLPIQETVTATASFAMFSLESESLLISDDIVFDLLADDNLGGNTLTTVNDFSIADQIDISSLLSDDATEANLAEFVTVVYDEETDSAVISIDRDGTSGPKYESQDLVVLLNQTSKVELDDLINNNQIIY
ncbi:Ig-like domain-containing protein [Acinetobacter amyesii]|uniref:Ig-like domain-containing protein n=1 Tax=Acinetobacter amyesii TaxID=2942470 RepID=UPI001BB46827|nr:Ig-like domain-containing protein [Acinetobacter amyesii]